jgi:hypothetical protein
MFFAASTRASRFFSLQLPFFRFNYHRQSIEVVVRQLFQKSPDRSLKFSLICLPVYPYISVYFLHLSLSTLYAYISIFISFYDRFSCLNAPVGHIWSTGYTTYGALDIPHMEHWIYHIWSTGYATYEALSRSHIEHWVGHMEHWIGHIWSTSDHVRSAV